MDGEAEVQKREKIGRITDSRSEGGGRALLRVFSRLVANKRKGKKGSRSSWWAEDGIV